MEKTLVCWMTPISAAFHACSELKNKCSVVPDEVNTGDARHLMKSESEDPSTQQILWVACPNGCEVEHREADCILAVALKESGTQRGAKELSTPCEHKHAPGDIGNESALPLSPPSLHNTTTHNNPAHIILRVLRMVLLCLEQETNVGHY